MDCCDEGSENLSFNKCGEILDWLKSVAPREGLLLGLMTCISDDNAGSITNYLRGLERLLIRRWIYPAEGVRFEVKDYVGPLQRYRYNLVSS